MRYIEDFIGAVKVEQQKIAASLVAGNATDMAAYKNLVGEHAGLQKALNILDNLLKEDDEQANKR